MRSGKGSHVLDLALAAGDATEMTPDGQVQKGDETDGSSSDFPEADSADAVALVAGVRSCVLCTEKFTCALHSMAPCTGGWRCSLLGRNLGHALPPPPWFNDPRTGAVGAPACQGDRRQVAATCGLHAVQHIIAVLGHVVKRDEFEARAAGDFDANGNYEYGALHRNVAAYNCTLELVTSDVVESLTAQSPDGDWAFFRVGISEGQRVLGYLVYAPGHWISVVPCWPPSPSFAACICDSLFASVYGLPGSEFAEWLEAMSIQQQSAELTEEAVARVWSAYRVVLQK